MKKLFFLLIITFGIISWTDSDTKADNSNLIGQWNWTNTDGGFAFHIHKTPQTIGETVHLTLMQDYTYLITKNGRKIAQGTYKLTLKKSIYSGKLETYIQIPKAPQSSDIVMNGIIKVWDTNKFTISDNNHDGIGSSFIKIDNPSPKVVEIDSTTAYKIDSILEFNNFSRDIAYEPLSLRYKGKSIFSLGQKIEDVDTTLSFRSDPNGYFWDKYNLVRDYLCMDDDLSIELEQGSINGIIFFSSDQKEKQIFAMAGSWTIATKVTKDNEAVIIEQITDKLFPILKDHLKMEQNWRYENKRKNYIEYFTLSQQQEGVSFWTMNYEIKLIN